MKKRSVVIICVLVLAAVLGVRGIGGRQSAPGPVPDLTYEEMRQDAQDRTGRERMDCKPGRKAVYGWSGGPPTMDGESHSFQEPLTEEITALLENSLYARTEDAEPVEDGVVFEQHEGCVVDIEAYWDGKALWVRGRDGWLPYIPSEGFGEELERILNTDSDKNT